MTDIPLTDRLMGVMASRDEPITRDDLIELFEEAEYAAADAEIERLIRTRVLLHGPYGLTVAGEAKRVRREVRFYLPETVWQRWNDAADALDYPLATWIRLRVDGWQEKKDEPPPPVHDYAKGQGMLRDRLRGVTGDSFKEQAVPALARQLGVPRRALTGSIGSLVASKRLDHVGDEYRWVKQDQPGL